MPNYNWNFFYSAFYVGDIIVFFFDRVTVGLIDNPVRKRPSNRNALPPSNIHVGNPPS